MGDDVHERERRFPKKRPAKAEILAAGWPEGDGRLLGLPEPENKPTGFLGPKVHNLDEGGGITPAVRRMEDAR